MKRELSHCVVRIPEPLSFIYFGMNLSALGM